MFTRARGSRFVLAGAVAVSAACAKGGHSSGFEPPPEPSDASNTMVVSPPSDDGSTQGAADDAHATLVFADAGSDAAASDGGGATCDADVCDDAPPVAICGDGIINGTEQCDDGNTTPGDGCSASCRLEPGFACIVQPTVPNSACHPTTCGDGKKEGFEQCDDGNLIPYDGCSPTCTIEPKCNGTGGCTGVCGDGLVFPPEQCDDGNTISGDGCSATCMLETGSGYGCKNVNAAPAATLNIPILYRDMLYHTTTAAMMPTPAPPGGGHPDFNYDPFNSGHQPGLVVSPLGADSEPVLNSVGTPQVITNATSLCWWYHDKGCGTAGATNPYAKLVYLDASGKPMTLPLTETAAGSNAYTYSSVAFFPIDGLGWNAGRNPQVDLGLVGPVLHNFSFTSELHYVFTYDAVVAASATPSVFNFTGDDDVWAFINGLNVVDLGGMHDPLPGMITLDTNTAALLGLVDGGWYSIDLFQAERHVKGSDYSLTLGGFVHTVTQCQTVCGDGIAAGTEQCDNGAANVPAASNPYGRGVCTDACKLTPYCGDGIVQAQFGEKCDGTQDCGRDCKPVMPM
jgi:fibro-slime domain-containing protein